ncbi:hypothetical protein CHH83_14485 [Bacillus sp. 7586-K]|uniref:Glucan phosphoethanolaminetransferase (Alkaline phosphatase superfamily) n=1 Tax=Metabacillus niabensis TaxID=324854 RepID=A0ABT9YZ81_9BACI|nr:DUF2768 domain-containing protein [Metabacillus niabensis]MDQ0225090.1 glucan phosphoethanolaminetransferase (alkaline phosphatase superfamily) [Metabacillus niabensis]PAD68296.1 hypothetical protein CHH83_14485 [Bacillus sp. 7586-K]
MSIALMKMWISFASMGFMFIAIILIYLSRFKLKNGIIKFIVTLFAYIFMILAGIIILFVVFSGPVSE